MLPYVLQYHFPNRPFKVLLLQIKMTQLSFLTLTINKCEAGIEFAITIPLNDKI